MSKPDLVAAQKPRGLQDRIGAPFAAEEALVAAIGAVYERWGFQRLETPGFEFSDALGKHLPDQDRPNAGVFSFRDDDERWVSLRYDLTAPLARFVAEAGTQLARPFRRWQSGPVWRNEKPGPGRFREFIQCDADTVGAESPAADAEMIALAAEGMEAAGLARGDYVVRVNDRRILDGVLDAIGAPTGEAGGFTRLSVLRAIDKLDRLGEEGVARLLGEGRRDESGDYTVGAGLAPQAIDRVLAFTRAGGKSRQATLAALEAAAGDTQTGRTGLAALAQIDAVLCGLGMDETRAVFDPAIVRGLAYYTGPVFEAELRLAAPLVEEGPAREGAEAAPRFGSVGGGGRYDDLVARFTGERVPATGFSFGVSRFAAALAHAGRLGARAQNALAVVLALDREHMGELFALAAELRGAGLAAEVYLGGSGMKAQMKYADRRGARFAVILGEDERKAGAVTVKDLLAGAQAARAIASHEEWRAARPAQETIARGELAAWAKAALAGG